MSDQIDFAPLQASPMGSSNGGGDLDRLTDVSVELTVEVGRTRMTLGQTLGLGPGSVVHLDHLADKPVDLLVNGRVIARGEVVVVDEEFGLRITEVMGPAGAKLPGAVVADFAALDQSAAA
jgi:flagellar motor switch protein FliN/FliY